MNPFEKKKGMGVVTDRTRPHNKLSNNDLLQEISDEDDLIYEMKLRFNELLKMVTQPQLYYKSDFEKEARR